MKPPVGIFYIGLPRFRTTTKENHRQFFELLKEKYSCNFYDFTTSSKRENCPYDPEEITHRGPLQVWDFANAISRVQEDIIIKFRTDILITPSASFTILNELNKLANNEIDISFLGHSIKNNYSSKYKILDIEKNVGDLIIIANKKNILSSVEIIENIKSKEPIRSGNLVYPNILNLNSKGNNIACQLYIIRKEYDTTINNWEWSACKDYLLSRTPKKSKLALEWFDTTGGNFENL